MNPFTTNLQREVTAMKKRNIFIHCLVLLMLIATLAACASTPTRESAGEYVDDSAITTKVKSLLANDDFFKSFQISVETHDQDRGHEYDRDRRDQDRGHGDEHHDHDKDDHEHH